MKNLYKYLVLTFVIFSGLPAQAQPDINAVIGGLSSFANSTSAHIPAYKGKFLSESENGIAYQCNKSIPGFNIIIIENKNSYMVRAIAQ